MCQHVQVEYHDHRAYVSYRIMRSRHHWKLSVASFGRSYSDQSAFGIDAVRPLVKIVLQLTEEAPKKMDANPTVQKETYRVVLHALTVFCYFVLFVTIDVVQKCVELAKEYMNKQNAAVGAKQPPSVKAAPTKLQPKSDPNYESIAFGRSIQEIKAPANTQGKAGIRDPQYQTLVGLSDEIFKKK